MKALRFITILAAALVLTSCGASKKAHPDDPWPEFSYVKVDAYKEGKIVKREYAAWIGRGTAPTQFLAEKQAEADAQARMAEAFNKDKAKLNGVTRVGETLIRFDKYTRMYTVFVRVGVPAKKN
ncbi:MAG: hypothetical protein J5740_02375 [Bacteroidales bacterium]|nr:hypothetical protein [Bacteroidales bacterium]